MRSLRNRSLLMVSEGLVLRCRPTPALSPLTARIYFFSLTGLRVADSIFSLIGDGSPFVTVMLTLQYYYRFENVFDVFECREIRCECATRVGDKVSKVGTYGNRYNSS